MTSSILAHGLSSGPVRVEFQAEQGQTARRRATKCFVRINAGVQKQRQKRRKREREGERMEEEEEGEEEMGDVCP